MGSRAGSRKKELHLGAIRQIGDPTRFDGACERVLLRHRDCDFVCLHEELVEGEPIAENKLVPWKEGLGLGMSPPVKHVIEHVAQIRVSVDGQSAASEPVIHRVL